jgi:hypothetical protein
MAFSFSDILREHIGGNFFKFKRGQVYAVKTQEFYQKTKIKLFNKEDCYKITFKNKAFVFILKNDYLKDDYRIYINTAALEELINEKQARYCGRCEEDLLKSVEETYG